MLTESIAATKMQSLLTPAFPKRSHYLNFLLINNNKLLINMARPERFELPTAWFVGTIAELYY